MLEQSVDEALKHDPPLESRAVALVFGSVILIDPEAAGSYAVPVSFSVTLGVASAVIVFLTVFLALKARRRPVVSGREDMLGASGA